MTERMEIMSSDHSAPPPFLDAATVSRHLTMGTLIPTMERTLVAYSEGKIRQPDRQMIPVAEHGGFFGAMPAVGEAVGLKMVTFYPRNADRGLPTHLAVIQLFDPESGEPLVIMDGRLITEMRTAAVSAAVVNTLIRGKPRSLAVFGTGVQARAHIEALNHVSTFDEIRVWGRSAEKAEALAEEVGGRSMSAEEAAADADVVVTATASKTPILLGAWLKEGAVVAAVGWNSVDGRELDDAAMTNVVVVESRSGTSAESGNVRGAGADIYAEAGEIISGCKSVPPGRTAVFDSVGMACEDVAAAKLVWDSYAASIRDHHPAA